MASEEKKSGEERLVKTTETKDTKKHRGIPEALFLVSIYLFIIMPSIFDDSASRTYREIPSINAQGIFVSTSLEQTKINQFLFLECRKMSTISWERVEMKLQSLFLKI